MEKNSHKSWTNADQLLTLSYENYALCIFHILIRLMRFRNIFRKDSENSVLILIPTILWFLVLSTQKKYIWTSSESVLYFRHQFSPCLKLSVELQRNSLHLISGKGHVKIEPLQQFLYRIIAKINDSDMV